jgi:hypothetical protein
MNKEQIFTGIIIGICIMAFFMWYSEPNSSGHTITDDVTGASSYDELNDNYGGQW